jgi:hypothetical protein
VVEATGDPPGVGSSSTRPWNFAGAHATPPAGIAAVI